MLRLACGIAVVAAIFVNSPERPAAGPAEDASRWIDRTRAEIAQAALNSGVAQEALRRTLQSETKVDPKPAR